MPAIRGAHVLRHQNVYSALGALLSRPSGMTRSELAEELSLSNAAISEVIRDVVEEPTTPGGAKPRRGAASKRRKHARLRTATPILTEHEVAEPGRSGAPAKRLRVRDGVARTVGLDFSRNYLAATICDAYGNQLRGTDGEVAYRIAMDHPIDDVDSAIGWMAVAAQALVEATNTDLSLLAGVGVSVPAPVEVGSGPSDPRYGMLRDEDILPTWADLSPVHEVKRALGWDRPFYTGNDASLALLAERSFGIARGHENVLLLKWSEGIGGAAFARSAVDGSHGCAGEIGHCRVRLDAEHTAAPPRLCTGCGRRCLESVAGLPAIRRDAGLEADVSAPELIALARSQETVQAAIERAAKYVGQVLGTALNLLNPELVIIGGAFNAASYDLIRRGIRDGTRDSALRYAFRDARIVCGDLTGRATVTGAVALVMENETVPFLARLAGYTEEDDEPVIQLVPDIAKATAGGI